MENVKVSMKNVYLNKMQCFFSEKSSQKGVNYAVLQEIICLAMKTSKIQKVFINFSDLQQIL